MKPIELLLLFGILLYQTLSEGTAKNYEPPQDIEDQLTQLAEKMTKLEEDNVKLRMEIDALKALGGSTYIRWGRRSCQNTTSEMVYLGVAGGTSVDDPSSGANLLCLPRDPSFSNYDSTDRSGHRVVGAEYFLDDPNDNFPFENTSPLLHRQDVPCAMCKVTGGSNAIMVPARRECYTGWTVQYRGYLMVGGGIHRNEYVCVDEHAEADIDGSEAEDSLQLWNVEASCGTSLPCPPYTDNYELACVVCSQ